MYAARESHGHQESRERAGQWVLAGMCVCVNLLPETAPSPAPPLAGAGGLPAWGSCLPGPPPPSSRSSRSPSSSSSSRSTPLTAPAPRRCSDCVMGAGSVSPCHRCRGGAHIGRTQHRCTQRTAPAPATVHSTQLQLVYTAPEPAGHLRRLHRQA